MTNRSSRLPIIEDCKDCGVCCFHMGYPAFMLPRPGYTKEQIANDQEIQQLKKAGWTQQELLDGHPGESHWHNLPSDLKTEWQSFVDSYQKTDELDDKCFWLDPITSLCKHHQYRPQVCRDFETGCKQCRQWRRNYGID